jgi:hypothetical protein
MKICLLKQVVCNDLYVCSTKEKCIKNILSTSQMRSGIIGIFETFDTDFYIVDVEKEEECNLYKKMYPNLNLDLLKTTTLNKIKGQEHKIPGSDLSNGFYSVDVKTIDFNKYDIVISINICAPSYIVKQFTKVLWCYLIIENNMFCDKPYFNYDVILNQNITGNIYNNLNRIDFSYTFMKPDFLYNLFKSNNTKNGIFVEINSCVERPVIYIPDDFKNISINTKEDIILHNQVISTNFINLVNSKYFVKLNGRIIRGNSVIEAISANTLVLINKKQVYYNFLIPDECHIQTKEDIINKINQLNGDNDLYLKLLNVQKDLLQKYIIDIPLKSLMNAYNIKVNILK